MALGSAIRRAFGPFEHSVSAAYRALFVDIGGLAKRMELWVPDAENILEVGCGEGAVTELLRTTYPNASITAIDVMANPGRLYRGSRERVRFRQCPVQDIAATDAGTYDLVVLSDVLHHVQPDLRRPLLDGIRTTLAPGGYLVFKDWERSFTPIHWLSYASDRWLTGDRIAYLSHNQMLVTLAASFGEAAILAEARIAPWRNNITKLVRP